MPRLFGSLLFKLDSPASLELCLFIYSHKSVETLTAFFKNIVVCKNLSKRDGEIVRLPNLLTSFLNFRETLYIAGPDQAKETQPFNITFSVP